MNLKKNVLTVMLLLITVSICVAQTTPPRRDVAASSSKSQWNSQLYNFIDAVQKAGSSYNYWAQKIAQLLAFIDVGILGLFLICGLAEAEKELVSRFITYSLIILIMGSYPQIIRMIQNVMVQISLSPLLSNEGDQRTKLSSKMYDVALATEVIVVRYKEAYDNSGTNLPLRVALDISGYQQKIAALQDIATTAYKYSREGIDIVVSYKDSGITMVNIADVVKATTVLVSPIWVSIMTTSDIGTIITLEVTLLFALICILIPLAHYILCYIEFNVIGVLGILAIPFGILSQTRFILEKFVGALWGYFIKMLASFLILTLAINFFTGFVDWAKYSGAQDQFVQLLLAGIVLSTLAIVAPGVAQGLLTGSPALQGSDVVKTTAAGGIAAVKGAQGAGNVAGATVKSANFMAHRAAGVSEEMRGAREAAGAKVQASGGSESQQKLAGDKAAKEVFQRAVQNSVRSVGQGMYNKTLGRDGRGGSKTNSELNPFSQSAAQKEKDTLSTYIKGRYETGKSQYQGQPSDGKEKENTAEHTPGTKRGAAMGETQAGKARDSTMVDGFST